MKKKLVSLLLAGSVVASMAAIASVSASAIIDSNGCYAPGENVTCGTYRYYFAMPNTWLSEYSDTAGVYWADGTDACGALDGSGGTLAWPGYKAQRDEYKTGVYGLYFIDCPTDVTYVVWNNYVNGGTDKEAPIYLTAKQSNNAPTEFYVADDSDLYDQDWFDEMEESYSGDKAKLGDFADNFFYDEEYGLGFAMNFDNMIFIVPPTLNGANFEGKPTYVGDWYFYFGDGTYGAYPTKEESIEKGKFWNLGEVNTPDEPTSTTPGSTDPTDPGLKPGQPSTDPASATKPASSTDTPTSTVSGGAVQTGEATYAVILLVVLAAVSGVVVFTRKKYN